jgi:hypothetical protein
MKVEVLRQALLYDDMMMIAESTNRSDMALHYLVHGEGHWGTGWD